MLSTYTKRLNTQLRKRKRTQKFLKLLPRITLVVIFLISTLIPLSTQASDTPSVQVGLDSSLQIKCLTNQICQLEPQSLPLSTWLQQEKASQIQKTVVTPSNVAPRIVYGPPLALNTKQETTSNIPQTSPSILTAIKQCESGGNYSNDDTGHNGHYGAYQFSLGTWESVGGVGDPAFASPQEQDYRATLLYKLRGTEPWAASEHCWN